ncbi:MAG: putative transposase [Parcubacteria group bacterium Gr01-1014_48]|nr:MAG: putative transposase [Parcubacteria group bacterium Greene0416_14]TSC71788.1 MAG: putative transposase [Parcubacteria group bacterium Gr01-1014_48]TSD00576.1 MAG: putative transposase [Parcubacteria group bacterium Greene1014_15]TSD08268.1 MAG: putative transposase [Parcubacteria group bacterium Greene0714_4]
MARQARVDIAQTPYHVINRAVGRTRIFRNEKDYQLFMDLLIRTQEKTGMHVLAFTLMPNHWHLVLFPEKEGDMKTFMHLLTNAHTRRMHTVTKTTGTGPLYQGRYKSFIIQKDAHLLTVIKYVERNPVRAGLVRKVEDWRWGSGWIRARGTPKLQKMLSKGPTPLPTNYGAWVNTQDKEDITTGIRTSVNKGAPFGSNDWVNMMVDEHKLHATLREGGRPKGSKNVKRK